MSITTNKEIYKEDIAAMTNAVYQELVKRDIHFNSVEQDDEFHDFLTATLDIWFNTDHSKE
jgi:hypothetical protein